MKKAVIFLLVAKSPMALVSRRGVDRPSSGWHGSDFGEFSDRATGNAYNGGPLLRRLRRQADSDQASVSWRAAWNRLSPPALPTARPSI